MLGDLPSQSLQAVLLHEQEKQPNPVGLPWGRRWRGGWRNWTHRQTTLHVFQVSEWQVLKSKACRWRGWWLRSLAKNSLQSYSCPRASAMLKHTSGNSASLGWQLKKCDLVEDNNVHLCTKGSRFCSWNLLKFAKWFKLFYFLLSLACVSLVLRLTFKVAVSVFQSTKRCGWGC